MSSALALQPGRAELQAPASERERWFRAAFDHVWDAAVMVGRDGLIQAVNRIAQEWFQVTHQLALGQPVNDLVRLLSAPDRKPVRFPWTGGSVETPKAGCIVHGDGRERWVSYRVIPVDGAKGSPGGVALILHDESWRQQHEQSLAKVHRLEPLAFLASGIAHDFNNFLTIALGNVQLVKAMVSNSDAHAALRDAEVACSAAAGTAKQLLRFVRGSGPVRRVQSLAEVIEEVAPLATAGTAVRLEFAFDHNLAPVSVDRDQMNQVVQNLALNAVQALAHGGTLRISGRNVGASREPLLAELAAKPGAEFVRVDFSDNGPGIAPENLGRIFEPFFTTKPGGEGLGLALSQSIVRQHGGLLAVTSTPGAGSTFTLFLPSAGRPPTREEPVASPAAKARLARILLVEDEETVRSLTAKLLTKLGYRVTAVPDGEQALQEYHEARAASDEFGVVITDLTLRGGIGGRELAAGILETNPNARLIVTSGFFDQPLLSEYCEYGFCGALRKPYMIQDLQCAVQKALDG